jgi:hypothetical protein
MKFKKGSAAAKAFMAKIRAAKGKPKKTAKKKATKKIGAVKKKAAPKKKATVKNYGSHKDTASHNVKISVVSGIGSLITHFKDQYGKLSTKKLMEKTKREKNKITKQMTEVAAKIKKLKNFLSV